MAVAIPNVRRTGMVRARLARRVLASALVCLTASACAQNAAVQSPPSNPRAGAATEGFTPAQEFEIVDCLLPGQVRSLGRRTYLTPRRPTRTTVADCRIRGGEATVYDRANYKTSLQLWLPLAEEGDAQAAVYVGELYERGIDGPPDYEQAAAWYAKAAETGFARAQYKLGALYEQGLGVERDVVRALNLYRESQGIDEGDLVSQRMVQRMLEEERASLATEIDTLNAQIATRDREISSLNQRIESVDLAADDARQQIAALGAQLASLETEQTTSQTTLRRRVSKLAELPATPAPVRWPEGGQAPSTSQYGRYFALIIGVQNYSVFDNLRSPHNDVDRIADTLEQRYGFTVVSLVDPSDLLIMKTINDLFEDIGEDDNLLIYFAGRGNRTVAGEREIGYWLPSNADLPPDDTYWVGNVKITNHLARIKARRVLVISDAAYEGLISDDPNILIGEGYDHPLYLRRKLPRRSRLLLASGTESVAEGIDNSSLFASALLDTLRANQGVLAAPELFIRMDALLRDSGDARSAQVAPELKAIDAAGHELGDFFFVPRATTSGAGDQ